MDSGSRDILSSGLRVVSGTYGYAATLAGVHTGVLSTGGGSAGRLVTMRAMVRPSPCTAEPRVPALAAALPRRRRLGGRLAQGDAVSHRSRDVLLNDRVDVEVPSEVNTRADGSNSVANGVQDADRSSTLSSKSFGGASGRSGDAELGDGLVCIGLPIRNSAKDFVGTLARVVEDVRAGASTSDLGERVDDAMREDAKEVHGEQVGDGDSSGCSSSKCSHIGCHTGEGCAAVVCCSARTTRDRPPAVTTDARDVREEEKKKKKRMATAGLHCIDCSRP